METYREWLKQEFAQRCEKNRAYSLRAFARDLALYPSHLSDIFREKQGLSNQSAKRIAESLNLPPHEAKVFVAMVETEHSRNPSQRIKAKQKLDELRKMGRCQPLEETAFQIISNWYHFAIIDLILTDNFVPKVSWVAQKLGINEAEVSKAVHRLEALGLITIYRTKWTVTKQYPSVLSSVPSAAGKKYHLQLMEKAKQSLFGQPMESRDFSSTSIPINPDDIEEIREEIKVFRRSLAEKYKSRANKKSVYGLCIQFFSLLEGADE